MTPELVSKLEKGEDETLFWLHLPNGSEELFYLTINQLINWTDHCWRLQAIYSPITVTNLVTMYTGHPAMEVIY